MIGAAFLPCEVDSLSSNPIKSSASTHVQESDSPEEIELARLADDGGPA